MKRLKFEYRTMVTFGGGVIDHAFLLRCIPREEPRQHLESCEWRIEPETEIRVASDYWGNTTLQGVIVPPHDHFGFKASGVIRVDLSRPRKLWHPIFSYPTEYTQTSPAMEAFTEKLLSGVESKNGKNPLSKALCLMNGLYAAFEYRQNVTRATTKAAEAFALGRGVCQDYAHMLTAMCIYAGIPARYVAGFMPGEGHTHAWVEIFSEGSFYGLDPTNNLMADETYIKLAQGRNAMDCSVLRGGFKGNVRQDQDIFVHVEEIK